MAGLQRTALFLMRVHERTKTCELRRRASDTGEPVQRYCRISAIFGYGRSQHAQQKHDIGNSDGGGTTSGAGAAFRAIIFH